jgi:hypothetical protein
MVFGGGEPDSVVGGVIWFFAEDEDDLLPDVDGEAAEQGAGLGRQRSDRIEYELVWDRLARFGEKRIERKRSRVSARFRHGCGDYTGAYLALSSLPHLVEYNSMGRVRIRGLRTLFVASDSKEITMAEQSNAAAEERRPDPNEKLVKVFDSEQESEAMVVKGLLDSAGIESDLKSGAFLQEAFPGLGGMIILVREEDAEKARSLIAESRQPGAADEVDDDETKS